MLAPEGDAYNAPRLMPGAQCRMAAGTGVGLPLIIGNVLDNAQGVPHQPVLVLELLDMHLHILLHIYWHTCSPLGWVLINDRDGS